MQRKGPASATEAKRIFYEATDLLDEICEQLGLTEDFKNRYHETLFAFPRPINHFTI